MNLHNSFPQKNKEEIQKLCKGFYKHLCDIIVESVRLFSMPHDEAQRRFKVLNPDVLDRYYDNGKPVLLVGAHYNNWELLAVAMNAQVKHQAVGIYSKIENEFFMKKMLASRTKYGLEMVVTRKVSRYFVQGFDKPTVTIFGSDQSPTYNKNVVWTQFLNQETAVASGLERYAKKYNYPVVFGDIQKVKRGQYTLEFFEITDDASSFEDGQITKKFTRMIEDQIKVDPRNWLWTHKRWKRKRQADE